MVPGSTVREGLGGGRARAGARFGRSWWAGLVIVALCLAAQWPGVFTIPPVDRDECRFAQATRQIVEAARAGDWENAVVPRVRDVARLNKPVLIYYAQGIPAALFDRAGSDRAGPESPAALGKSAALPTGRIWAYRLVSLLSAMATALLTWRLGLAMRLHPSAALLGGAFMATCLVEMVDARQARADELLVALTVATQLCLWRVWSGRRRARAGGVRGWGAAMGFWLFLGLGAMTKGPITPMVAGLSVLALGVWGREWRWVWRLKPVVGVVVLAAVVLPWFVAVTRVVGLERYWSIVVDEVVGHSAAGAESHWGPPGYHLVLLAVLLFPGTLFTLQGVVNGIVRTFGFRRHPGERYATNLLPLRMVRGFARMFRRRGGRDWQVFALAWALPSWIVFELAATKLPHYTLPLYPALALISARALLGAAARGRALAADKGVRAGMVVYLLIAAAVVVGAPVALIVWGGAGERWVIALVVVGTALGVAAGVRMWRLRAVGSLVGAQWMMIGAVVVASVCVFGVLLPRNANLWVSSRLVLALERASGADGGVPFALRPVASVGYHEDSLVFLTRGRVEWIKGKEVGAWLGAHPGGFVVVPRDVEAPGARVVGKVKGFNYSNGRWERLGIVTGDQ